MTPCGRQGGVAGDSLENIAGMRDVISHGYEDVQYEILWDAVRLQFPALETAVTSLLEKFGP